MEKKHYIVVVLGDIGRSPRMQNHAVSLSKLENSFVHIVGYNETPLFTELQSAKNVKIHQIKPFPALPRVLFPIYAPLKIIYLFIQLFILLFFLPEFETVLAQNPPTIPTIPFCYLLRLLKGKKFVIDWHNLGWSILKCNGSSTYKILKPIEHIVGRLSDDNFTVTKALQKYLLDYKINSTVLYDKPSSKFKSCRERREEFAKKLDINSSYIWIMSSTSWTSDEKIDWILDAADILDKKLSDASMSMVVIITGKGPNKRSFETEVKGRNYVNIDFKLEFLSYEDYASLLGTCDAGVSFHISSSGFDLPMKGLDMIGSGLPLISVKYFCIEELVQNNVNGILFEDAKELADVLEKIFIKNEIDINELRRGAEKSGASKWEEVWNTSAKKVVTTVK